MDELQMLSGDVVIGADALVDIIGESSARQVLARAQEEGYDVRPRAAALVGRPFSKLRTLYLGVPGTALGAALGAAGSATVKTTNPIKLTRLVIPRATAALINVTQLDIGSDKQILNANPLPGDMFAPDSFEAGMSLDTLNPQIDLYLSFATTTAGAITVYGAFKGEAARA